MDSDTNTNYSDYRHGFANHISQSNSGLLRYRSAPSSLFANFSDGLEKSCTVGNSVENQGLTPRFGSGGTTSMQGLTDDNGSDSKANMHGFAGMNSQLPPQYPRQSPVSMVIDVGGYRVVGSMGMEQPTMGSSLTRQNSSPAGLFSQNGYATMRGPGRYGMADCTNGDLSPSSSRLKNQMNLLSRVSPSLGQLSRIKEVENENGRPGGIDDAKVGNSNGDNLFYHSGFPFGSWNDSSNFAENFNGIKRELDDTPNIFSENQNGELGNMPYNLAHHSSLPKTSAEMASLEKLLELQGTVPCKIRAKRGCATHPRSIAERVRRTRISERMRKLQELVPNMDKQMNTSDMLDLAVDYIKNLQKQYKILSDNRANCKCSAYRRTVSN